MKRLDYYWYSDSKLPLLLLPLSGLFCLIAFMRRMSYRLGIKRSVSLPVPVIVVGNITAGGSGKTPLVVWLAEFLERSGYRPGIISRGYGGQAEQWPQQVTPCSDPRLIGDEPLLIVQRTGCPMWVGPDRVAAASHLLQTSEVDVIISDDGMQHYRLARDIEIAVVDGERRYGNGHCLPAGPLREPMNRLETVDMVVANGPAQAEEYNMDLTLGEAHSLSGGEHRPLADFLEQPLHAVAGIGNPQRFFNGLTGKGLKPVTHPFSDHHSYSVADIDFGDQSPVLMTEKDAVKCLKFGLTNHWFVPVNAKLSPDFGEQILALLKR